MIDIFMPGRFCVFGEHSDWASEYKLVNDEVENGFAIAIGLDEGIFLSAEKSALFSYEFNTDSLTLDRIELINREEKDFFEYVVSCAKVILKEYGIFGIHIVCRDMTLPMKKGLASSASICMGVIRAFNLLYNLKLKTEDEMAMAYRAEQEVGSKCGKLDQICAYGSGVRQIEFDSGKPKVELINCKGEWNFLIVDLNGEKNTKQILSDLNKCYPYSKNSQMEAMHEVLGKYNKYVVGKARRCFEKGDALGVGKLMVEYQTKFDSFVAPFSDELKAPLLHMLFDEIARETDVLGYKGVGSQGDGMAQIIVSNKEKVEELEEIIWNRLNMNCINLSIRGVEYD